MDEVRIWEEDITIPTYEVGRADKNPMFLEKRVYQGSSGKIYPYPATQEISKKKTDKVYRAVWLENRYLKIMILPQLGGRIQRAYDKTNGYDFIYYNRVIKPALVGLLGPWISGGIEFNWPQHHRPTTFMPVDYKIVQNEDGSMSLQTGDTDQMYGTKEMTEFRLYPDKAYIEITGQLYNRTPLPQTFLWWANPAVAVNDHTQSIFPPDVHSVYDHGKRAVSRFPIATGEYYKHDYSEGVDISRYKNIPVPTSYMAERSDYNFVGGYDYSVKAGLLHVADHHVSTGKKQWTWGCGDFGKAWDRNLTDEDGPYIELMTGMYCDNQPDFTWLKPYEEKKFKQYFMPYKAVGQVKNASIHAALNVEEKEDGLYVCAYATQEYSEALIVVKEDGKEIYREQTKLSPVEIYEKTLDLKVEDIYRIQVSVRANGRDLVAYQAKDQGIPKLAEPAKAALSPEQIQTQEELYLTGRHIEQYRHATFLPDPYYLEGLKRDPSDSRINNAYGLLLLRRGCFEESEAYFRKAIERLCALNPNPYNSEAYYNLGLSLFYQERFDEAFDAFYKAAWSNEQQEMSYYFLAAIAARKGEYEEAKELVEKSLVKNIHNVKANALHAMLLEKLGRVEEKEHCLALNLKNDPFDYGSVFVKILSAGEIQNLPKVLPELNNGSPETLLNIARDLAEAGFYVEALRVLDLCSEDKPLIHYYKGYYYQKILEIYEELRDGRNDIADFVQNDTEKLAQMSREEYKKGEAADSAYTFPNKSEDILVLRAVIAAGEQFAKARYYLGCLFYDKLQYTESIRLWEEAAAREDTFPTLLRNLAIAYYNKKQEPELAREYLEKAFRLDETDARVFLELDQLYRVLKKDPKERLELYEAHKELIYRRDDLYVEYVTVLNLCGKYKEAFEAISSHSFATWEGAEGKVTTQFKLCLLELAKEQLHKGEAAKARENLLTALSYPENLGEGRLEGTKDNHLYYHLALAEEMLGNQHEARENFKKATLGAVEPAGMMYYYDQPADMILYQGLAKKKLGDRMAANARFYKLLDYGEHHFYDVFKMDYFAVSMPDFAIFDEDMDEKNRAHCYYLMGLGRLGLGQKEAACACFMKTLKIDPAHQNAAIYLKEAQR